jgi:hypothetical protein
MIIRVTEKSIEVPITNDRFIFTNSLRFQTRQELHLHSSTLVDRYVVHTSGLPVLLSCLNGTSVPGHAGFVFHVLPHMRQEQTAFAERIAFSTLERTGDADSTMKCYSIIVGRMVIMMYCQRHRWRLITLFGEIQYFLWTDNDDTGTGHHTSCTIQHIDPQLTHEDFSISLDIFSAIKSV